MSKVRIFALGGLDEDGKNMYVVQNNDDLFVMECGMKYPETGQLGVEMIIPDFRFLSENKDRIKGVFITHGHDDVMAALPSLLQELPKVPVYMAPLTALMFERKAKKAGLRDLNIHRVMRNAHFKIGKTEIITFGTTQSIADGFGVAIKTADGYVVYSSEFIVDYDTKNEAFDFNIADITELSGKVVLLDFHLFNTKESATRILSLRELYNKYHDQGFEIYQVGLDENEHFWKQQTESLPWISVYDPSAFSARNYNVQSIPEFFLIDRSNALYKRSLQMDDVETEIKALLANPTNSAK